MFKILQKANQIAGLNDLQDLLVATLHLFMEITQGKAGSVFVVDPSSNRTTYKTSLNNYENQDLLDKSNQ